MRINCSILCVIFLTLLIKFKGKAALYVWIQGYLVKLNIWQTGAFAAIWQSLILFIDICIASLESVVL